MFVEMYITEQFGSIERVLNSLILLEYFVDLL